MIPQILIKIESNYIFGLLVKTSVRCIEPSGSRPNLIYWSRLTIYDHLQWTRIKEPNRSTNGQITMLGGKTMPYYSLKVWLQIWLILTVGNLSRKRTKIQTHTMLNCNIISLWSLHRDFHAQNEICQISREIILKGRRLHIFTMLLRLFMTRLNWIYMS